MAKTDADGAISAGQILQQDKTICEALAET
jgi:hypothetical protein